MKDPFDPLTSGWIWCDACDGIGRNAIDIRYPCPACDTLGIVVGPSGDGKHIATFFDARSHYHPDLRPIFTQEYWRERD